MKSIIQIFENTLKISVNETVVRIDLTKEENSSYKSAVDALKSMIQGQYEETIPLTEAELLTARKKKIEDRLDTIKKKK